MKKFDLHIHSTCSRHKVWGIDGINTPQEIVEMAVQVGLDGIAIADHNTIKGSQRAIEYVKEKNLPLLVIPAAEVRSNVGDILAIGISQNIKKGLSVLETIEAIQNQNGIAIAAHPYKYNTKISFKLKNPSIGSRFDAVEIFNAGVNVKRNYKAKLLAEELKKPSVANSDAHYIKSIGYTYTYLDINNSSIDEALSAIQKNKISLQCSYPPLRNTVHLYTRKIANLFKKTVGKGIKPCE